MRKPVRTNRHLGLVETPMCVKYRGIASAISNHLFLVLELMTAKHLLRDTFQIKRKQREQNG